MNRDLYEMLASAGIERDDAFALRRIAMTLRRWRKLTRSGNGDGIERDKETGIVMWYDSKLGERRPYPDRETGALKRLAAIMARYPTLKYYLQDNEPEAGLHILLDLAWERAGRKPVAP